jgi:hypothetical protein
MRVTQKITVRIHRIEKNSKQNNSWTPCEAHLGFHQSAKTNSATLFLLGGELFGKNETKFLIKI